MRKKRRRGLRPIAVVLYAALIVVLLSSYIGPLRQISKYRAEIPGLEQSLKQTRDHNSSQSQLAEDLKTPAGIEQAARHRYGMIKPGEKVYIIKGTKKGDIGRP